MHSFVGTLPGWLTLATVFAIAWVMLRGGSGTAVSGLQDINRELERQVHARDATIVEKDLQIAELKAQKDVATALVPVLDALVNHEERAQSRHTQIAHILDMIAERMGKFENGH